MYLPSHFREERPEVLHEFMERHPLATLVTSIDGNLNADHLPMLLDCRRGASATLLGHVARGNALWRRVSDGTRVLAIFGGADSYVSPSWYPSKKVTGQVVPTWNYCVVHVHGKIRFFDDASRLRALVSTLTDHHERSRSEPWSVNDAPGPYVEAQLRAIVGFEIEILEAVGKFKASQNRTAQDRAGVHAALSRNLDADAVAELIRAPRPSPD